MTPINMQIESLAIQLYESGRINSRTHASAAWVNASEKTRKLYRDAVVSAEHPEDLYQRDQDGRMFSRL
jgi:hypothetical protein